MNRTQLDPIMSRPSLMSGRLELVDPKDQKKPKLVNAVIYKTSTRHFVAVFPLRQLPGGQRPMFCVGLESAKIETNQNGRELKIVKSADRQPIVLRMCDDNRSLDAWIKALKTDSIDFSLRPTKRPAKRPFPRKSSLAILSEDQEE